MPSVFRRSTHESRLFHFSANARKEIGDALGGSSKFIIPQLEAVSRSFTSRPTRADEQAVQREIAGIIATLRLAMKAIDSSSNGLRESLQRIALPGDISQTHSRWQALSILRKDGEALLQRLGPDVQPRKRGRPSVFNRKELSLMVGFVLALCGIPIATNRTGTFAKVLSTVLVETYGHAPEDVFPLVKRVSRFVKEMPVGTLYGVAQPWLESVTDLPEFWWDLLRGGLNSPPKR